MLGTIAFVMSCAAPQGGQSGTELRCESTQECEAELGTGFVCSANKICEPIEEACPNPELPECEAPDEVSQRCDPDLLKCPGNRIISTAASIESLRGCTRLDGWLRIEGDELTNLEPLAALCQIDDRLTIENADALVDASLPTLETVEDIYISGNTSLRTMLMPALRDLSFWDSIGKLTITLNNELRTISMPALEGAAYFTIDLNPNLNSIGTFEKFRQVADLEIARAHSLEVVDAFPALETARNISITLSGFNQRIGGFDTLIELDEDLLISQNGELALIHGFNALTTVGGTIRIYDNNKLQQITGFTSLQSGDIACAGDVLPNADCEALRQRVSQ